MDIRTYNNFLTHDECNYFIELIKNKNAPSFTNTGNFINKKWTDLELSNKFYNRLMDITNDTNFLRPNNLIMAGYYQKEKSFGIHTDTGLYYNTELNQKSRWTLLIYLNDNFDGGETVFYDTNTWNKVCEIKPKIGKALLFDIDLWHSGSPIVDGEKYWIGCEIIGYINE